MANIPRIITQYGMIHCIQIGKKNAIPVEKNYTQMSPMDWREYTIQSIKNYLSTQNISFQPSIYTLNQIHGKDIYETNSLDPQLSLVDGDGLVTRDPYQVLCIRTADCVPLLVWGIQEPMVAILHVGWRGAKEGIWEEFLNHYCNLNKNYGFWIGPSIRGTHYEVGEDVAIYFQKPYQFLPFLFKKNHRYFLDLPNYLMDRILQNFKVPIIWDSGLDTYGSSEWYSHRFQESGRNISAIYFSLYSKQE